MKNKTIIILLACGILISSILISFNIESFQETNSTNSKLKNIISINYKGYNILTDVEMSKRMKNNTYEKEEIELLKSVPIENLKVLDIGACLGILSIIVNNKLLNKNNHVAVEANPKLIPLLTQNKNNNKCKFKIENSIISKKSNGIFYSYDKLVAGSAHRKDNREKNKTKHIVNVISLENLILKYNIIFNFIIMDIEGGELEFIKENKDYIKKNVKYILVEIHEFLMYNNYENECKNLLKNIGMKLIKKDGTSFLYYNNN